MSTAPVTDQIRLLEVQALDTRLQQISHAKANMPATAALAEVQSRVDDLESAAATSRTALADLRRELAKAELDVEQVKTRMARDTDRLNSGSGTAKDLQALQSEVESLSRRLGDLEEVELEVMERVEEHESVLAQLESAIADQTRERNGVLRELDSQLAELGVEEESVRASREQKVAGLADALVSLYERLRGQLGGLGAAALHGRRCEGCRLELNASDLATIRAASPEEIVRCEECGRVLVRVDMFAEQGLS